MAMNDIIKSNIAGVLTVIFVAGGLYVKIQFIDDREDLIEERISKHREYVKKLEDKVEEMNLEIMYFKGFYQAYKESNK